MRCSTLPEGRLFVCQGVSGELGARACEEKKRLQILSGTSTKKNEQKMEKKIGYWSLKKGEEMIVIGRL